MNSETSIERGALGPGPGGRRIVVAMSGGVDSSVAAALLRRAGHDVVGITLQLYDHGAAVRRSGACCAGQDIHDARRAADKIGIPHYVLDYEQRFRTKVIDRFAASYMAGETPVPCATCNSEIKFTDLLATAEDLGAATLATGHYIQLAHENGPVLRRARDAARDQSYFLFATTKAQLSRLMFPLGGMTKPEVRALAHEFGLELADKPDSQDICFVASGRYSDVIAKLRPDAAKPGDIVHVDGGVLGRHAGIIHFTVGQRKGLGIASGEPLFVVRIDAARGEVVVGPRSSLATTIVHLSELNWLGDRPAEEAAGGGLSVFVRLRSSQAPQAATLFAGPLGNFVALAAPEYGVAKGQACAIYVDGGSQSRVLGGGWIARVERGDEIHSADLPSVSLRSAQLSNGPSV